MELKVNIGWVTNSLKPKTGGLLLLKTAVLAALAGWEVFPYAGLAAEASLVFVRWYEVVVVGQQGKRSLKYGRER